MSSAAEQHVIGGIFLIGDLSSDICTRVLGMLKPGMFVDVDLQIAFEAIQRLAARNGTADIFTVESEAKSDERCRETLSDYLAEIAGACPSSANIVHYAEIVKSDAVERYAVQSLHQAIAMITDKSGGDIYQRLGLAESKINAIQDRAMSARTQGLRHAKEVGKSWLGEVQGRVEGGVRGFTLGIDALDRLLYPKRCPAGSLIVVGARPKQGKTAFMAHIVEHFALDRKEAVACFSLEMPETQIYERLIVGRSHVDPELFYIDGGSGWQAVTEAAGGFNESMLYIDDTPGIRLNHVLRETRKLNRKHKVGLVAVDYLTLMEADTAERNDLGYGRITKALKGLAKELNCVVLLLSQLNRGLESRPDKRPFPSDSRDTGQIEQDCDLWIGLYREGAYSDTPSDTRTEAIVRLNRHGKTGTVFFDMVDGTLRETHDQSYVEPIKKSARY